jgi:hypothetical protein
MSALSAGRYCHSRWCSVWPGFSVDILDCGGMGTMMNDVLKHLRQIALSVVVAIGIVAGCLVMTAVFMYGVDVVHDRFGGIGVLAWGLFWLTTIISVALYARIFKDQ